MHHGKGTDQRNRHRHQRNDRGAPGLQEQDHHQHHQAHRFQQRGDHRLDGCGDELGRVEDDAVVHAFGHVLLQLGHHLAHFVADGHGVGARRLQHEQRRRRLVVQQRAGGILGAAQLDPGDIAQAGHRAVGIGAHDDVAEFLGIPQAALHADGHLGSDVVQGRAGADDARRGLQVLLADRRHHVARRQAALVELLRVQPDAHGVLPCPAHLDVANALDARQTVAHIEDGVVVQVAHVIAAVRRYQVYDQRQVRRGLHRGHAKAAHLLGQARLGLGHAVLHQLLGQVRVHAQAEGDGQGQQAVGGGLAAHVEHVLDAVDGFLQGHGHGLGDHLRAGAGEARRDHDRGRHHFRVLGNRQLRNGHQAAHQQQDGEDGGEDRPVDEVVGEVHWPASRCSFDASWAAGSSRGCGATRLPARMRCRPLMTMRSSSARPDDTTRLPSMRAPRVTAR
ncbi:hypothetical protein D3C80_595100 [compost metagenome]